MNRRSTPAGAKVNGSQIHPKQRCFALLSMTNNVWVNCYIIALIFISYETIVLYFVIAGIPVILVYIEQICAE